MDFTYDAKAFADVFEANFTWLGGFERNVRRFAEKTALIDPARDRIWTYAGLDAECSRFANALHEAGLGKNDVLFYQLYNCPEFAFCYIAPQKLGAINSPASFNLAAGETALLLDHNRPRAYVYDCDVRAMAAKALEISTYKPDIIIAVGYRGERPALPPGHVFYDDFVAGHSQSAPTRPAAHMYDEVTRLYTSGTTGLAKAIPVNNVNEVLSAHDVIMSFPLSERDVTMNMTPWFHRGGLHSGGLTPTLYAGGTVVTMRMFSAKSCLDYADKFGVSFLIGVPAALEKLADRQEKHPTDLSHLRGIVTMGSPLEREACIRFQNLLTPNIFNGYGTTETFWNSFLRPSDLPERAGSAGRACIDDEVRVVRVFDDGRRAEPDDTVPTDGKTAGEIIISSWAKSSMSYLDNEPLTGEKFYKGWFYTHDLGTWDESRYITVLGRKDDMMICMGENIYPAQVEEVICRHGKVKDCIVTGVADPARGQAVAAYVVPSDETLTIQELARHCAGSQDLADYKCPRYYCLTDAIPYNATGKKRHFAVRDRALEDLKSGKLKRP
ncbi:MAG: acyl--CoA ligase [Butyricicoccus sp.]|nr:acyl--CoA ligase [Butyricicoccus sp.]